MGKKKTLPKIEFKFESNREREREINTEIKTEEQKLRGASRTHTEVITRREERDLVARVSNCKTQIYNLKGRDRIWLKNVAKSEID